MSKSSPGFKRPMIHKGSERIHKDYIPHVDPINPVQKIKPWLVHICLKSCKSAAGLKKQLIINRMFELKLWW